MTQKISSLLKQLLFFLILTIPIILSVRGLVGNITESDFSDPHWTKSGPFELSPERGRFALTFSLIEDHSVFFSIPVARFALPDLGYKDGNYVSLFAPTVSFIAIPGYLLGKALGVSQVGAFATSGFFALLNFLLVRAIGLRLGTKFTAATLGAMVFLFATPAFAYSTTLYQHHISTFLILTSLYLLISSNRFWSLCLVWFHCSTAILVDYPNLFLMFPIGILTLRKSIEAKLTHSKIQLKIRVRDLFSLLFAVFPLAFFLWFNQISYGNPLQLSGTISSVETINENGLPTAFDQDTIDISLPDQKKTAIRFFYTRNLLNGLYTHSISLDRGVLIFSPVILLGLLGLRSFNSQSQKKNTSFVVAISSIIGINLILYSLWGDPWGGWAFGSRYLIPTYALLGILLGSVLERWAKKSKLLPLMFFALFIYSTGVNSLGAVTTNLNPPRVEILELEQLSGHQEKFSFDRNLEYLFSGNSKSFVFNTLVKDYLPTWQYFLLVVSIPVFVTALLTFNLRKNDV